MQPFFNLNSIKFNNISFKGASRSNDARKIDAKDGFETKNLFHFLKKKLRTKKEIEAFILNLPAEKRYMGSLPDNWRKQFPPDKIKDKTSEIGKIFSDFAKSSYTSKTVNGSKLKKQALELEKRLTESLNTQCRVSYINSGQYGKVFKIEGLNEELALKIFHNDPLYSRLNPEHGRTKEIANAIYYSNAIKPNQSSRFYMGKLALDDEPDGFMLTSWVKSEGKERNFIDLFDALYLEYKKFTLKDKGQNTIQNRLVDFGAISLSYENFRQQDFAKKLIPLIKKGDEKEILKLKEKYADDKDFIKASQIIMQNINYYLDEMPALLLYIIKDEPETLSLKELKGYRALGADFSPLKKHINPNNKELLEALGIQL